MKLVKSLLLGSAAGIAAIAGANAADLPSKKSAPVEYVRVCSQYGAGFFYVPGSDTCIQLGGRVRADTLVQETWNRNQDSFNFGARARLSADVRTNTPYGTVRAYLRYQMDRGDRNWSGSYANAGTGVDTAAALDKAYIQFAGLTAGRATSFFDFYANNNNFGSLRNSDKTTNLLAYTASFGNGISFTAAIEDGNERRVKGVDANGYYGYRSAGQSAPDGVLSLNVQQGWGAAQLSGAIHQIRPQFNGLNSYSATRSQDETDYGFAVKGGVKVNLPMIAPGDELWVEAAYADGAISYVGGDFGFHPNVNVQLTDAAYDVNGNLKKTKAFSATVAFLHYWTPSVRQNVFGSYMKVDYSSTQYASGVFADGRSYNVGLVPTDEWRVGTNVIWSPVKNFDIGVEVLYMRTDPKGRVVSANNGYDKTISYDDAFQGRLRVQRDF